MLTDPDCLRIDTDIFDGNRPTFAMAFSLVGTAVL